MCGGRLGYVPFNYLRRLDEPAGEVKIPSGVVAVQLLPPESAAPAAAAAPAASGLLDEPQYAKYVKLLKLGQPFEQLKLRMMSEGLDPNVIAPLAGASAEPAPAPAPVPAPVNPFAQPRPQATNPFAGAPSAPPKPTAKPVSAPAPAPAPAPVAAAGGPAASPFAGASFLGDIACTSSLTCACILRAAECCT